MITALALNIASNMAVKENKSVGFFSIEMSRAQLIMRLLALKAEIGLSALMSAKPHLSPKEWEKLELGAGEFEKARLFIDDSPSLSIIEMKTRAQEVAVITASLKELAKELDIPVVACAQLNRAPEQRGSRREGPKYQLSDLKESGAIEQDADLVMFLHREEQNDKDTERKGEADLIIAKQRNGPTGKIVLAFLDKFTKFHNIQYWE